MIKMLRVNLRRLPYLEWIFFNLSKTPKPISLGLKHDPSVASMALLAGVRSEDRRVREACWAQVWTIGGCRYLGLPFDGDRMENA